MRKSPVFSGLVLAVMCATSVCLYGCATTHSSQVKNLIQGSDDPKFAEAMITQLREAGADDAIIQERFALDDELKAGKIREREYQEALGKLQVRMDANRVKREKEARDRRAAFSILQSVAGAALSSVI